MRDLRFAECVAFRLLLEPSIRTGQPVLVLSQVFCPGSDQVGLDKPRGVASVAEDLPPQGPGAPPRATDTLHGVGEICRSGGSVGLAGAGPEHRSRICGHPRRAGGL